MEEAFPLLLNVGPSVVWLLVPYGLATAMWAVPWPLLLDPRVRPGWVPAVFGRFAASALNALLPSGVAGEPLRLRSIPVGARGDAGEAILWDRALFMVATGLYVGATALLLMVTEYRPAPAIFVMLVAACLGHVLLGLAFVGVTRVRFLRTWAARLFRHQPGNGGVFRPTVRAMWMGLLIHFVGRWVNAAEVWVAAWLLGVPLSFDGWVLVAAAVSLAATVFPFVPGQVGVQEATISGAVAAVGMPPSAGLAISLLVRVRQLVYVPAGMFLASSPWLKSTHPQGSREREVPDGARSQR